MMFLLLACANPDGDSAAMVAETEPVDDRIQESDVEALSENDLIFWGADLVIEPYADKMWCLVGTYNGPDVALHRMKTYQGEFGHHFQILGMKGAAYEDGELLDCSVNGSLPMGDLDPLLLPTEGNRSEVTNPLPEGMAFKLRQGQRYVLQSHYLNTSDKPVRVRDAVISEVMPMEDVKTWTAPLVANHQTFTIPPGEEESVSFDCTYKGDYSFIYLDGHMHEWGKSFKAEVQDGDSFKTVFEVPTWDPSFRDNAPVIHFDDSNRLTLKAGQTLRTTCTWYNNTDSPLEFPNEMCDTVGMVYPALVPDVCSD